MLDQGFTDATRIRRCRRASFCPPRFRSVQMAATMMATPPPCEVPSKSKFRCRERRRTGGRAGRGTHSAVHAVVGRRESSAQIVDGVNGGMGRESGDGESPGKGVAHQAMNQDERRAGASLEVAHASVGEIEPMLFDHGCRRRGSGAGVGLATGRTFLRDFAFRWGNEILATGSY